MKTTKEEIRELMKENFEEITLEEWLELKSIGEGEFIFKDGNIYFKPKEKNKPKQKFPIVEEFNKFIEKWTGNSFSHLIDSDENDGERFRERLRELTKKAIKKSKELRK